LKDNSKVRLALRKGSSETVKRPKEASVPAAMVLSASTIEFG